MSLVVHVDIETTGLQVGWHDPWEIALIADQPGGPVEYLWHVEPDMSHADAAALRISNFYARKPATWDHPRRVAADVARVTAGATLVGACTWFDAQMLDRFLRRHGQAPAWHHRLRCVESLVMGVTRQHVDGLRHAAEAMGVAQEDAHTAMGDARTSRAVWHAVMGQGAAL